MPVQPFFASFHRIFSTPFSTLFSTLACAVLLAGCGSKDDTSDTDATTGTGTGAGTGTGTGGTSTGGVPFSRVRDRILAPTCGAGSVSCHEAGNPNGPVFDANTQPSDLVGVESTSLPGAILVVASDPDGSYIVQKITDAPGIVGDPMPPPFGNLPTEDIDLIKQWISEGAQ